MVGWCHHRNVISDIRGQRRMPGIPEGQFNFTFSLTAVMHLHEFNSTVSLPLSTQTYKNDIRVIKPLRHLHHPKINLLLKSSLSCPVVQSKMRSHGVKHLGLFIDESLVLVSECSLSELKKKITNPPHLLECVINLSGFQEHHGSHMLF